MARRWWAKDDGQWWWLVLFMSRSTWRVATGVPCYTPWYHWAHASSPGMLSCGTASFYQLLPTHIYLAVPGLSLEALSVCNVFHKIPANKNNSPASQINVKWQTARLANSQPLYELLALLSFEDCNSRDPLTSHRKQRLPHLWHLLCIRQRSFMRIAFKKRDNFLVLYFLSCTISYLL